MNGRNSIVYELECDARALCSQQAATANKETKFYIATQNRKPNDHIHSIEYNEDRFILETNVFAHPVGEVVQLRASPHDSNILSSCYRITTRENQSILKTSIIRLPEIASTSSKIVSDLIDFEVIKTEDIGTDIKTTEFHPADPSTLASIINGKIIVFQRTESQTRMMAEVNTKNPIHFFGGKWSQHHEGQFIGFSNNRIKSYDIRDPIHCAWKIIDSDDLRIRDLDCNLKKLYRIVTGYDDGTLKVWDSRKTKESLFSRNDHTDTIWSIRYNRSHDQLILSSGSDNKVVLTCADSVSSESDAGHFLEGGRLKELKEHLADGLLHTFEYHNCPVYSTEWSSTDPWLFASLSCDGKFVLSKVPKQFKYRILI